MVIFRRIQGPVGNTMSGGRGLIVLSLLQNKEAGGAKANISLIKIITGFNKVREEVKALREAVSSLTWSLLGV